MPPDVLDASIHEPLHRNFEIVDEESLHLLVAPSLQDVQRCKTHYSSFDDTLSTSIMDSSCGELSDEDAPGNSCFITTPRISGGVLKELWNSYYNNLQNNPLIVKSITAFVLMLLADLLAQGAEHLRGISALPVNWLRSLRFGVFGLFGAPWTHYYYHCLDTVLPPTINPWTWTTFAKVSVDQGVQAPAMLALIVSGLAFMEGRGWDGITSDMQSQYVQALLQNWKLWIPATVLNIAFVQPSLRVLYDNLVFFVWTVYLSVILNQAQV